MNRLKVFLNNIRKHFLRQFLAWRSDLWFVGLSVVLVFAIFLPMMAVTIPAGSVGVEWRRFGGGTKVTNPHSEGMALIMPWNRLFLYDTRVQVSNDRISALSADGLNVEVELAWAYHLVPEAAGLVHKVIGPDYGTQLIGRIVSSVVRSQMASFHSEELHSGERLNFEKSVNKNTASSLADVEAFKNFPEYENLSSKNWIIFENVMIKEVRFPPAVQDAYVRKNTARALVDEYNFRIVAEQKEVERKRTEALGIRGFQEIVNTGLSESYLKWRGIEATLALSQSSNAKVIVIGGGGAGLPLILNTGSDAHNPTISQTIETNTKESNQKPAPKQEPTKTIVPQTGSPFNDQKTPPPSKETQPSR